MRSYDISEKHMNEFKELCDKKGIKYETEDEYRQSMHSLVGFFDTLIEMDMVQRSLKKRLETEPKGFALDGGGRNCSLCRRGVYEGDAWYDKWGFKCMNCQDAVNKKKIPGSLCGDWEHKKCITDSELAWRSKLHAQTIRKLIRGGDVKARRIPNGPFLILRKDNPQLNDVIETEVSSMRKTGS